MSTPAGINKLRDIPSWGGGNILVNGDFCPGGLINQRGQASYANTGYCIDGWKIVAGPPVVEPTTEGLRVTAGASQAALLQYIENSNGLLGKTLTLSFQADGKTYFGTVKMPSVFTAAAAFIKINAPFGTVQLLLQSLSVPVSVYIHFNAGTQVTFGYIKLKEGNIPTPLACEDPAIALARCRRFLFIDSYRGFVSAFANVNYLAFDIPELHALRANPVISNAVEGTGGNSTFYLACGTSVLSGFTLVFGGGNIRATKTAHGFQYAQLMFRDPGPTFSAEI
jgi:hypothetical protein